MRAGKLRALAVSSPARSSALPDVPTFAEADAADAQLTSWLGLMAPAGTPQPIIDMLSKLAVEFVGSPEAKAYFEARGYAPFPAASAAFAKFIVEDQAKWKHYISLAGMQPQ